jgi:hypothetical protein
MTYSGRRWINRFCVKSEVEVIMSEEIDDANPKKAELFNIEITPDNNEQSKNFSLPFDVINIRKMAVYEKPDGYH